MKGIFAFALVFCGIAINLQAQFMSIWQDGKSTIYETDQVDSINFDQNANLWESSSPTLSYYYAPGWSRIADPTVTLEDGTYTLSLPTATSAQWQAQMFMVTELSTDCHKRYNFQVTLTSTKAVSAATVKLYQDGEDDLYYFNKRINLTANKEYTLKVEDMDGLDMDKVSLVLDFGGNAANTVVKVKNLSLTEEEYNSALNRSCPLDGYSLVWYDEFNSGTISSAKWTYQTASAGWVNNELQTYIASRSPNGAKVSECTDGTLKIHTFKEGEKIYSARMYGRKSIGFKYGYIEARIKLPKGKGTWPAFWMMPVSSSDWPACGEIDIMEEVGYNPNVAVSTIHCTKYNNGGTATESGRTTVVGAEAGFHIYAVEWTADYMTFYVDGQSILTYKNDGSGTDAWPFDKAFYPILNMAWGGSWGGVQGVDETALPTLMEVDYVRVWQKK